MHATQLTAPRLQTFYSVYGRTDAGMQHDQTLEGYRGSAPVLVGNAAQSQLQLDAYGSVMTAAAAYCSNGGHLGASEQRRLQRMADVVIDAWSLPDDGLWEMPGPRVHNTYSKMMCWAALDAFVTLCRARARRGRDGARTRRSATASARASSTAAGTRAGRPSPAPTGATGWMPR